MLKSSIQKKNYNNLKLNVKLEEVVAKDFFLEKFGKNYFTTCPFCGAKKALSISIQKQFGHCFSCNESFDAFGYYQKVKGLSFTQAVMEVKKHINLETLNESLAKSSQVVADVDEFIAKIKRYLNVNELTRAMSVELIERVIIGATPKDKNTPIKNTNRL